MKTQTTIYLVLAVLKVSLLVSCGDNDNNNGNIAGGCPTFNQTALNANAPWNVDWATFTHYVQNCQFRSYPGVAQGQVMLRRQQLLAMMASPLTSPVGPVPLGLGYQFNYGGNCLGVSLYLPITMNPVTCAQQQAMDFVRGYNDAQCMQGNTSACRMFNPWIWNITI